METGIALIMIIGYKINKEPELGYQFIKDLPDYVRAYPLINFFEANLALRSGNNEEALAILNQFDVGSVQMPFDHYNYMYGNVYLRKLDPKSRYYFNQFLSKTKYKSYTKEVTYKIAESYLVEGNTSQYEIYKEKAEDTEPDELVERDREAIYDSELDYDPHPSLLRVKLLVMGGYLNKAEQELTAYMSNPGLREVDKADYHLQYGKLLFRQKKRQLAIIELEKAIDRNPDSDYQIAAEAAVVLGRIYEYTSLEQAREYYNMAIEVYEEEYYEVIESYAKRRLDVLGS